MALMLMVVYAYIEWCNEYERIEALKAKEEVKRVEDLQSEVEDLIRKNNLLDE